MSIKPLVVVIGGGAAGLFGAIRIKEHHPHARVVVLEKSGRALAKLKISGGGRCNVTHHQFDPRQLVAAYPRGEKELLGPFHQFQPQDMVNWLSKKGVMLKTEQDGRIFPVSDCSQTIIDCFLNTAAAYQIEILYQEECQSIRCKNDRLEVTTPQNSYSATCCLIATGSHPKAQGLLSSLGIGLVPQVPSLFTFDLPGSFLLEIPGTVFPHANLSIPGTRFQTQGPVLVTHTGISGPATLKLSAFAALELHQKSYRATILMNCQSSTTKQQKLNELLLLKKNQPFKDLGSCPPFQLTRNCYAAILKHLQIDPSIKLHRVNLALLESISAFCHAMPLEMAGKSCYKEEFVTAGGVDKKEINFKTMEHKRTKRLFFAGEVIDIDGITGGYNFQNAWTTADLAALGMKLYLEQEAMIAAAGN